MPKLNEKKANETNASMTEQLNLVLFFMIPTWLRCLGYCSHVSKMSNWIGWKSDTSKPDGLSNANCITIITRSSHHGRKGWYQEDPVLPRRGESKTFYQMAHQSS
jgi:hypothetical protein